MKPLLRVVVMMALSGILAFGQTGTGSSTGKPMKGPDKNQPDVKKKGKKGNKGGKKSADGTKGSQPTSGNQPK